MDWSGFGECDHKVESKIGDAALSVHLQTQRLINSWLPRSPEFGTTVTRDHMVLRSGPGPGDPVCRRFTDSIAVGRVSQPG